MLEGWRIGAAQMIIVDHGSALTRASTHSHSNLSFSAFAIIRKLYTNSSIPRRCPSILNNLSSSISHSRCIIYAAAHAPLTQVFGFWHGDEELQVHPVHLHMMVSFTSIAVYGRHLPPVASSGAANAIRAQASQARIAVRRVTALRTLGASSNSSARAVDACVWLLAW
jgi:hypothetical protein